MGTRTNGSRPIELGEPGPPENPIQVHSPKEVPPGGRIVGLSLGGVELWSEEKPTSPQEMRARITEGLRKLQEQDPKEG